MPSGKTTEPGFSPFPPTIQPSTTKRLAVSDTGISSFRESGNALKPILVTLSGIVTRVSPEHPLNASPPMDVTPSGIVTRVKAVQ